MAVRASKDGVIGITLRISRARGCTSVAWIIHDKKISWALRGPFSKGKCVRK